MTKLNALACDRCGKIFHVKENSLVHSLLYEEETIYHLCEDCDAAFQHFLSNETVVAKEE